MRARQWVRRDGELPLPSTRKATSERARSRHTTLWGWPEKSRDPLRYSDRRGSSGRVAVAVVGGGRSLPLCLGAELRLDVPSGAKAPRAIRVQVQRSSVAGMGALSCATTGWERKVAGEGQLVRSVAMSGGVDIQPATGFRLIASVLAKR